MFKLISSYNPNGYEFAQLQIAAEMLTEKSPNHIRYYVADSYYDDRMWTTILGVNDYALMQTFQALTTSQQEEIIFSKDLQTTTDELLSDKWGLERLN